MSFWEQNEISMQEHIRVQKLKTQLIQQYAGIPPDEIFKGENVTNRMGGCYHIARTSPGNLHKHCVKSAQDSLTKSLFLLHGIRDLTQNKLRADGYHTIKDLCRHPGWKKHARELLALIRQRNIPDLQSLLDERIPKSHPLVLSMSGFYRPEDFLFLDIETLGLFAGNMVVLIGLAACHHGQVKVDQYLALDAPDEIAILHELLAHLNKARALVTFNGKAFDVPFLEGRLAYYGLRGDFRKIHFDLLHFSRRAWQDQLPDCSLGTIEQRILKTQRCDDVPGALVPGFYDDYMRNKNFGLLKPIVEHNQQDLVSLVQVFSELCNLWKDKHA